MATVNQQIDALLKRRGNPARKGKSPNWVVHLRNFATKKSKTVTMPGGLSEPEAMRNAVLKAGAYWQVTKVERDLNENPRVAARSVVLVAAKNPGRVNITKRKDTSTQHLQFYVRDVDAGYDVASFFNKKDAVSWGQKYADKTNHNVSVRREDEK